MKHLRPHFHITADKNWINDPNGLIKYKGQYNVFMQHHPFGLKWGPMHWYHVVSNDLLHWEHLPIALYPGDSYDKDGCFSGSAIIVGERLYVVYTGFIFNEDPAKIIQQQCLACSDDGVNFKKLGLIIGPEKVPSGYATNDFRDPMIFEEDGVYYVVVAARKLDGRGRILLYKSLDLLHWDFVSDILDEDTRGKMVECPDYIKNLGLLLYSEQNQPVDGILHHNLESTYYRVGELRNNHFDTKNIGMIDFGFDFYAPQVFANENILIGWMNMWERSQPSEVYGFAGQLTIPRRITVERDELKQTPVLPGKIEKKVDLKEPYSEHVRHGFYELNIGGLERLKVEFRKGEKHVTTFELKDDVFVFDRSKSGLEITGSEVDEDSFKGIRRLPYVKKDHHKIYFVLDEFSIEIFVDGLALTSTIYPELEDDLLTIKVGAKSALLVKYK